jgi:hypothetical protein
MAMECETLILAEESEVDKETFAISLKGIVSEIHARQLPASIPKLTLYMKLKRSMSDPSNTKVRVTIPELSDVGKDFPCDFESRDSVELLVHMKDIGIQRLGGLSFVITHEGREIGAAFLKISS